jgi:hypothetical protein
MVDSALEELQELIKSNTDIEALFKEEGGNEDG